ncbi:MAG: hypothetical protein PVJ42_03070 [bacterium]|jgi:hypothetical protein
MKSNCKWLALLLLAAGVFSCGTPENIEVGVQAPIQVSKGDEFTIVASVRNTAAETQKLVCLDIADTYLDGIAVLGTEPDYTEAYHVPISNMMSYTLDIPVAPGKQVDVHILARAVKSGDFGGEMDFCINSDTCFLTELVRTVVD